MDTLLLTIPEAAEECRMSESFIKAAIRSGDLMARRLGTRVRIERAELGRWIQTLPIVDSAGSPADRGPSPEVLAFRQLTEKTTGVRR